MSHASLLTWIPWEMRQNVAGLHADAWAPQAKASHQILASLWAFPGPGTAPLCGMSLVSVFCFFVDAHLGQASQFQTTLQSAKIPAFSTAGYKCTKNSLYYLVREQNSLSWQCSFILSLSINRNYGEH